MKPSGILKAFLKRVAEIALVAGHDSATFKNRKSVISPSLLAGSFFSCHAKTLLIDYIYPMFGDPRAASRKDVGLSLPLCKLSPEHIARPKFLRLSD